MILPGDTPASVAQAAQALAMGALVGFPTETVYGLGADAGNEAAVANIFAAKGRPSDHPLIVHVADAQGVHDFARDIPDFAKNLMANCWPGPLTLILPRREGMARASAGGQHSIGLRCPSHPVALALLKAARLQGVRGVSGPSANRFGRVSPTTAAHVASEFEDTLLILDGGPCPVGIESSIVDCTRTVPVLLRPGMLSLAELTQACGQPVWTPAALEAAQGPSEAPRVSGALASHYAPTAKLCLLGVAEMTLTRAAPLHAVGIWARTPLAERPPNAHIQTMPSDPQACARRLFACLRDFEALGVDEIWVEPPPRSSEWAGIWDRLTRAAAPTPLQEKRSSVN